MSIYPVLLSEWYPLGDAEHWVTLDIVTCNRCYACGARVRWKKAVGHHSLPFGYGDLWCGWKCAKSGKKAKTDKRRNRRIKRKFGKCTRAEKVGNP